MLCATALSVFLTATASHAAPKSTPPAKTKPPKPPASTMALGINTAEHAYFSSDWAFADAIKRSGGWAFRDATGNITGGSVDAAGWPILPPGHSAWSMNFSNIAGHYPAGPWTLTYDGDGDVTVWFDAIHGVTQRTANSITFNASPSNDGLYIGITRSNPENPVRNMRLRYPGVDPAATFHPLFLSTMRPFHAIRFIGWQGTCNYPKDEPVRWDDRSRPEHPSQTRLTGVAPEYIIDLCNELNADPWLCIPHRADDDYVRQFATLVRDRLRTDRKVYVEWTNEAWNWGFAQAQWTADEASRRGIPFPHVIADEAARVFRIFREVFKGQEHRIVRVAAGQHYWPWVTQAMLERLNGEFDAVACGGYFFPRDEDLPLFNTTTTPAQILESCQKELQERGLPYLAQHRDLATLWTQKTGRSIPLLVYEGGQHLMPSPETPWFDAAARAQHDPMMADTYRMILDGAKANGVKLFLGYSAISPPSRYGFWGALEYQDSPTTSLKYSTLLQYTTRR